MHPKQVGSVMSAAGAVDNGGQLGAKDTGGRDLAAVALNGRCDKPVIYRARKLVAEADVASNR
ncbi:hypothetical protein [Mycolicibacterium sp.]|jgi:hypothetical protein|uniref:hypothetical protein n=2 Tax=Mycobacteriaceae TaxID=1762 RepID=UPI000B2AB1B0